MIRQNVYKSQHVVGNFVIYGLLSMIRFAVRLDLRYVAFPYRWKGLLAKAKALSKEEL